MQRSFRFTSAAALLSFVSLVVAGASDRAEAGGGSRPIKGTGEGVVTGMVFNCRDFAIRVSGLGERWFRGPLPTMFGAKLFEGFTEADIEFMGGESTFNETAGLGGFAQAAAFPLQEYQGGSAERMIEANLAMYEITLAEHPEFKIPYLGFRGVPCGIEVHRVVETGITPILDIVLPFSSKAKPRNRAASLNFPLPWLMYRRDGVWSQAT